MENRDVNKINVAVCLLLGLFFLLASNAWSASPWAAENITISCDRWPAAVSLEKFGEDCVRLAGAHTNEAKAIAVWQYTQQFTTAGSPPKEPAYGNNYIISPLKLLNVYGVHWCDGLSRIMNMTWRSLGYRAEKLYKFGHTLADCRWRDEDGVERWHVFDLSQHWYLYDRTGGHIATPDELALDHSLIYFPSRTPVPSRPSPLQPSYVHAGHLKINPHDMGVNLRNGESIHFLWGNEGKPYYDLFKKAGKSDPAHGPYPLAYGNGRLVYTPDFTATTFSSGDFPGSVNLVARAGEKSPNLHPRVAGEKSSLVFKVSLPYVIADAWLDLRGCRTSNDDMINFFVSVDGGKSWCPIWHAEDKPGRFSRQKINFCRSFDPANKKKPSFITPFGRYDYLLKVEMLAHDEPYGCGLDSLSVTTVFQHNLFALPMLHPGENQISVNGKLREGISLKVSYVWNDSRKKRQTNTTEVNGLPFECQIKTKGKKWDEVKCASLSIAAGKGSENQFKPELSYAELSTPMPVKPVQGLDSPETIIGRYYPGKLKNDSHYINELGQLLAQLSGRQNDKIFLKQQAVKINKVVLALAALRSPKAAPILERVLNEDITHPCRNKIRACQALYRSVGDAAVPAMIRVLQRDSLITWYDPEQRWPLDTMWLHTVAMAAAVLAEIRDFSERDEAARLIAATLQGEKTQTRPEELWRGDEICWGLIKALGKLGGSEHLALLKKYLPDCGDVAAQAVRAMADIGDPVVVPDLVALLGDFQYSPVGLYTIDALGQLGIAEQGKYLYPFLVHWDEDFRGAAAAALGQMGDDSALSQLKEMLQNEPFPWVREAAQKSIDMLTEQ
ncbi:MAG: HEAT repeat domain-containing protein [Deltaproteobacteria bacterium]|nr:HEAT repeat domain-containing protein [Candidatus Tharpella sp.]